MNNEKFIYGVNLPWFGNSANRYQSFGKSPFSGKAATYSHDFANQALTDIKAVGFSAVRTWLFTGWSGTLMDENGYITGVSAEFLSNVKDYLQLAREKGLAVNLVLVPHVVQDVEKVEYQEAAMSVVIDSVAAEHFINNALIPTLNAISGYENCLCGMDLYCEPEGDTVETAGLDTEGAPGRTAKMADLTNFINAEAAAVKSVFPKMKCTVSSALGQSKDSLATFSDYNIEILGIDVYNDEARVSLDGRICAQTDAKYSERWITECNYRGKTDVSGWSEEQFSDLVRQFYANAKSEGYSACFMWHYAASNGSQTSLTVTNKGDGNNLDCSNLRLSAQLLHFDILDSKAESGEVSELDKPELLINADNKCLRWIGSRQASYYYVECFVNSSWVRIAQVKNVPEKYLYELKLEDKYSIGSAHPLRVVAVSNDKKETSSDILR